MSNNTKSVYERLDSIEATQSATQAQNKEIIDCPEWMKKMLFLPSAILILLLKYYT